MKMLLRTFALALGLAAAPVAPFLRAAPGDLDATFGSGGKVTTSIGTRDDRGYAVAVQPDGKIVVAGLADGSNYYDFALVRYNANGALDTDFGNGGKVITPIGSSQDYGQAVAVQADGKIVVVGYAYNNASNSDDFALARYNTNGTLDTDFGNGGKVLTPIGTRIDYGQSVALQADGKIVVAGYSSDISTSSFALARYNANGSLDTDFGNGGKVITPIGNGYGRSVALQADGKILVAGFSYISGSSDDFALVRYNANGSLDADFGNGGKVITPFASGSLDYGHSVAVQADGNIVVAGPSYNGSTADFALVRYTANGSLDTGFGEGGRVTTAISSNSDDVAYSIALQADGKILVAGYSDKGSNKDFALVRYNADGSLDASFGSGGTTTTAIGSSYDYGQSVALQADGKIVVAGFSWNGKNDDFALVRFEGGPFAPAVITDAASAITSTSALLAGTVNANGAESTVSFDYGLTADYGSTTETTSLFVNGSTATPVTVPLGGLVPHATYHYRAKATNSQGTTYGLDATFTTLNTAPVASPDSGAYDGSAVVTVNVLANDSDADGDTCSIDSFTQGSEGTVTQSGSNLVYTPGEDFFGSDSFTYTVSDGFGGTAVATVNIRSLIPISQVSVAGATSGKTPAAGDTVPGEPASTAFTNFGVPAINDAGSVAFLTTITTSGGNMPAVFDGRVIIARKGDAAPGSEGLVFEGFTDPALNSSGAVVFLSRLRGSGTKAKGQGLYSSLGGTLAPVIRTGDSIPGIAGAKLSGVTAFQLLDDVVLFQGKLSGVPANSSLVLCSWTPADGVHLLLHTGVDSGSRKVKAFTALLPAGTSVGHGRNPGAAAAVLARVTYADGKQEVVETDSDGWGTVVAQTAEAVPSEPAGAQWKSFGVPAINHSGSVAFLANLAVGAGGVSRANDVGLFAEIDGRPLALMARKGESIDGAKLKSLSDPVHNAGGDVAALVTLTGNGVTRANNKAIFFAGNGNSPELFVRTGAEASGVPGAKWKAFQTLALPNELGPTFVGRMAPLRGVVTAANDTGLWTLDSNGTIQLLVREGDSMEIGGATKTLKSFTVLALVPGSPNQTRAFNSARQLAYRATFTDGSQAIVRVQVP